MWLDQDLLQVSEAQRRGGVLPTTVAPGSRLPMTAPFPGAGTAGSGGAGTGSGSAHPSTPQVATALKQPLPKNGADASHLTPASAEPGFSLSHVDGATERSAQAHGYAKGFASGWAAGQRRAEREAQIELQHLREQAALEEARRNEALQGAMDQVASLAQAVQDRDELVAEDVTEALASAAIELAEALLGRELSDGPTRAVATLERALSLHEPKDLVAVHMNPTDVQILEQSGEEIPVKLVADEQLEPGDAVAMLPEGYLDARLSSALHRAKEALSASQEAGGEL